jgi:glycosyltransferase involved in cell wall biosynthesis
MALAWKMRFTVDWMGVRGIGDTMNGPIIMISHSSSSHGGAEYVFSVVRECLKESNIIRVIKPRLPNDRTALMKHDSDAVYARYYQFYDESPIISAFKIIINLASSLHMSLILAREKSIGCYVSSSSCCFGLLYATMARERHVLHVHEFTRHNNMQKAFFNWYFRSCGKKSELVFVSSMLRDLWLSSYKIEHIPMRVIYNPVKEVSVHEFSRSSDRFVFGFAGTLEKNKRIIELIEAFETMSRSGIPKRLELKIAGSGSLMKEVNIRAAQRDDIIFMGRVAEMGRFYSEIDVIVVPSECESFSLVAAEALKAGKPVVLHGQIGIAELLEDGKNAILYDQDRPDGLVKAMERIASDDGLYESMRKYTANAKSLFPTLDEFGMEFKAVCLSAFKP